jgi:hypothetical protein
VTTGVGPAPRSVRSRSSACSRPPRSCLSVPGFVRQVRSCCRGWVRIGGRGVGAVRINPEKVKEPEMAVSVEPPTVNQLQARFDAQKALFATGLISSYQWRVDQLERMGRMIGENERRLQGGDRPRLQDRELGIRLRDGRRAPRGRVPKSQLRSWMDPVEAAVPRFLRPAATRRWSTATRTAWHSSWVRSTVH